MKLTYFQLESQLTKTLAPIYVVSGDELILKQDAIQLIRKAVKKAGFEERIRLIPDTHWETIYTELYATSLLAEKRLLEIDCRHINLNKAAASLLEAYAAHPACDTVLLIDMDKLDDKATKSAWYRAIEKIGAVIPLWPIPREQLPQWIINRAKRYKLSLHLDAVQLLSDYVEGNLIAAVQAIEKIYLLKPEKMIDKTLIQAVLTDESHYTVFDFVDQLLMGGQARALHMLTALRAEGIEPTIILWAITRELRLLADCAKNREEGMTIEQVCQKHRIFSRRQPLIRQFLNRYTANHCWQHLSHAANIDKIIKGAQAGDVWNALQLFCLRLI